MAGGKAQALQKKRSREPLRGDRLSRVGAPMGVCGPQAWEVTRHHKRILVGVPKAKRYENNADKIFFIWNNRSKALLTKH